MPDPIKEFYPYKYATLLFFENILADAVNIGWRKCRKYIGWNELHIYDDDRAILSEAGDSLVDEESLDPVHLERLYEIWLRASTYNPRAKDFDKPVKIRKQWGKFAESVSLCKQFAEYAFREIRSFFSDEVLQEMPNDAARLLCYMLKFQSFVDELRPGFLSDLDICDFYDSGNYSDDLTNWIKSVYEEVEIDLSEEDCAFSLFMQLLNNFGFDGQLADFFPDDIYEFNPQGGQSFTPPATIEYVEGGGNFLFRIIGRGSLEIIEVDKQHPYTEQLSNSEEAKDLFESLARAYFHAKGRCGNFSDDLFEDFTSYLSLKLKTDTR